MGLRCAQAFPRAMAGKLVSPRTLINRTLRGRSPPSALVGPTRECLQYSDVASPTITQRVEDALRTAMSPEEGGLSPEGCRGVIIIQGSGGCEAAP